jgi:SAM-dependent methyltransferase
MINKIKLLFQYIKHIGKHLWGHCSICGHRGVFIFTKPLDIYDFKNSSRETMICSYCSSNSRKRHVAKTLLNLYSKKSTSLRQARNDLSRLFIYSAATNDHLFKYFGRYSKNYISSEYLDNVKEGESKDGVLCQNLERLTFQNNQFDLVITEDVFEHLRHPDKALKEIHRVTKPNGYYVFTMPMSFTKKTIHRVDVQEEKDIYLLPKVYHGDPLREGILVYNDFGYDFLDKLSEVGFDTEVLFSSYSDETVTFGIVDSYVFICRKK